jgi:hypothetical protein
VRQHKKKPKVAAFSARNPHTPTRVDARVRAMRARTMRRTNASVSASRALAAAFVAVIAATGAGRGAHAREFPDADSTTSSQAIAADPVKSSACSTTHVDATRIADDRGATCAWYDADWSTGCCPETSTRFACEGCDAASTRCCSAYDACVACCQGPSHDVRKAMEAHARGRNQVVTGYFSDAFAYCANRCRTQPSVTFHENTYVTAAKYCYGDYPKNEDPVPALKGKAFAGDSPDETKK